MSGEKSATFRDVAVALMGMHDGNPNDYHIRSAQVYALLAVADAIRETQCKCWVREGQKRIYDECPIHGTKP